jgi:phosphoribosyl-ATP pyrophosphohydrolase/phosphoribosyl-AMP cyclohydrolase
MTYIDPDTLDFTKGGGVVTVIAQDAVNGTVLMLAHADREAVTRTNETGQMHYTSRTRGLWHKGATSGNTQAVVSITADCDADSIIAKVIPAGPACHTGTASCFVDVRPDALADLDATIEQRARTSADVNATSYTQRLLDDRNLRLKKIGEEAAELVVACADEDVTRATEEAADLLYHTLVALRSIGVSLADVQAVLANRGRVRAT